MIAKVIVDVRLLDLDLSLVGISAIGWFMTRDVRQGVVLRVFQVRHDLHVNLSLRYFNLARVVWDRNFAIAHD